MNPDTPPANPPPKPPEPPQGALDNKPPAAPPPAAKTVLEGQRTEREVQLERNKRDLEVRVSELEDENRRLKTPEPPKAKKKTAGEELDEWLV
jgi:hypothetical protein